MKVSIVTVTWNSSKTILDTIESVDAQEYEDIEHIIVDGCSTDGTVDLVRKSPGRVAKVVSEPDNGIYDAMNKGIRLATGDVIGILNSDDVYDSKLIIPRVAEALKNPDVDAVFTDLVYVDQNDLGKVVRLWKSSSYRRGSFSKGWHPPHPTLFIKREFYLRHGLFDVGMEVSADFELMLRFFESKGMRAEYLPFISVRMRLGGESNRSIRNIVRGNLNVLKAFERNSVRVCGPCYVLKRLLSKVLQYKGAATQ